jgi:hypothetical protein
MGRKRNFDRERTRNRFERGATDEAPFTAKRRNEERMTQLYLEGGEAALEHARVLVAELYVYTGNDSFLLNLQRQAQAYGPTWLPSWKQYLSMRRSKLAPSASLREVQ